MARPRNAVRPWGVAICERLRMSSVMATGSRSVYPERTRDKLIPPSRVPRAEQRRDRLLVRFLLGVEDDHLLHGVERGLQFVADGAALDLEVGDGALELADALHGLADDALGQQLGVLDDELGLFARVGRQVLGHFLRGEQRVLEDA